jgi:hypothetical protein
MSRRARFVPAEKEIDTVAAAQAVERVLSAHKVVSSRTQLDNTLFASVDFEQGSGSWAGLVPIENGSMPDRVSLGQNVSVAVTDLRRLFARPGGEGGSRQATLCYLIPVKGISPNLLPICAVSGDDRDGLYANQKKLQITVARFILNYSEGSRQISCIGVPSLYVMLRNVSGLMYLSNPQE